MATERQRGVKGAPRTELVTIRFDPKTKYLMELAARVQRRSIANFVEWAVENALHDVPIEMKTASGHKTDCSLRDAADVLWDVEEADRFYVLASRLPNLLTHDEQLLAKLMQDTDRLWREGDSVVNSEKYRQWYPAAKYAVSTGTDLETIRAALDGKADAVQAIGLDKWAAERKGKGNG